MATTRGQNDTTTYPSYVGGSRKKATSASSNRGTARSTGGYAKGWSPGRYSTGNQQAAQPLSLRGFNPALAMIPGLGPSAINSQRGLPRTQPQSQQAAEPAWYTKSIGDFLAQALGMIPGVGDLYGKQEAAARQNNADVSGRLQALYKVLNEQNTADLASLPNVGAANRDAMQAATDAATQTISEGASADSAVMEQALRNGQNMEGAEGLLANHRMADRTQAALDNTSSRGQEFMNIANTQAQGADRAFRDNMSTLRGQTMDYEAANARNLLSQLAEIETQRLQAEASRRSQAASVASQLYSSDYGQFVDQTNYNRDMERDAYSRGQDALSREDEIARYNNELLMGMQQQEPQATLSSQEKTSLWNSAIKATSRNGVIDTVAAEKEYERLVRNRLALLGVVSATSAPGRSRSGSFR